MMSKAKWWVVGGGRVKEQCAVLCSNMRPA